MLRNKSMKKTMGVVVVAVAMLATSLFGACAANTNETMDLEQYTSSTYYYNGTIITVDEENGEDSDGNPVYAKAVIEADGYIVAVAYTDKEAKVLENTAEKYESARVDLEGKTMIPAFVDAHGHIDMVGQYYSASPSRDVTSLEKLVEVGTKDFNEWLADDTFNEAYGVIEPGGKYWFVTQGFENTAFQGDNYGKGKYAMPTKDILDKISTEYPIIYVHSSNHLCAVNSMALELLTQSMNVLKEYSAETYAYFNPELNWDKDENGEYTGILRENGFYALYLAEPILLDPSRTRIADPVVNLANAMDTYASYGITTAVGGGGAVVGTYLEQMPEEDKIIDIYNVATYTAKEEMTAASATSQRDENGYRTHCIKIFLDGSPQGKTAWFAEDLSDPSGGGYYRDANEVLLDGVNNPWWYGEAEGKKMSDEEVVAAFAECIQKEWQFTCHTNGTGAIQQYIDCYREALIQCGVDVNDETAIDEIQDKIRPVIIHGQTITLEQVEECKELGINISFFVDHTYYYGDYHLDSTLGPVRGQIISPMADAMVGDEIAVTVHQDAPICEPNMIFTIFNAANRITKDGQAIGQGSADGSSDDDARITNWTYKEYDTIDERISAYEALKTATINSAWQHFDEDCKGSISVGKEADFAILNVNILEEEFLGLTSEEAKNGQFVEQTINDGKVVYEK